MGYETVHKGEITITPSLTYRQFKDSPFNADNSNDSWGERNVILRVATETLDTDEGQLTRKTAGSVVPIVDYAFKGYDVGKHLQELIDAFPDHEFTGQFDCQGRQADDMYRLVVRGRTVVEERATFYMPGDAGDPAQLLEIIAKVRAICLEPYADPTDKIDEILPLVAEGRYGGDG